jgi:hypothetical protein
MMVAEALNILVDTPGTKSSGKTVRREVNSCL